MDELQDLKRRVAESRGRLAAMPPSGADAPGPADPKTGERWDRYNVLGHMDEFLPYWISELTVAIDEGSPVGRPSGSAERQAGIDGGRAVGEAALRERVDAGIGDLALFLERIRPADLDLIIATRNRGDQALRWAVETFLVGHVEDHCRQLSELG